MEEHEWENIGSFYGYHWEPRTIYKCRKCKEEFEHFYQSTKDKEKSRENTGISKECKPRIAKQAI